MSNFTIDGVNVDGEDLLIAIATSLVVDLKDSTLVPVSVARELASTLVREMMPMVARDLMPLMMEEMASKLKKTQLLTTNNSKLTDELDNTDLELTSAVLLGLVTCHTHDENATHPPRSGSDKPIAPHCFDDSAAIIVTQVQKEVELKGVPTYFIEFKGRHQ